MQVVLVVLVVVVLMVVVHVMLIASAVLLGIALLRVDHLSVVVLDGKAPMQAGVGEVL